MVRPAEKSDAKPTSNQQVNGVQKVEEGRKKPPPGKPYVLRKTLL